MKQKIIFKYKHHYDYKYITLFIVFSTKGKEIYESDTKKKKLKTNNVLFSKLDLVLISMFLSEF